MKIRQVVEAGQVTQSYVWNNALEFTTEGGNEVKLAINEEKLRSLQRQIDHKLRQLEEQRLEQAQQQLAEAEKPVE